jgi:hypothetical protein
MKTIALVTMLAATSAHANNWPPADPSPVNPIQATANAQSNSNAGAYSNQSLYNMPSTRAYGVSFSAPALAAALPGYLCPKGDSMSISVLGGLLFSYSVSTTRTEMECLDKLIAVMTAPQIVEHRLPVTAQIHPAPVAPIASSTRMCAPRAVRKAAKVCKR